VASVRTDELAWDYCSSPTSGGIALGKTALQAPFLIDRTDTKLAVEN